MDFMGHLNVRIDNVAKGYTIYKVYKEITPITLDHGIHFFFLLFFIIYFSTKKIGTYEPDL